MFWKCCCQTDIGDMEDAAPFSPEGQILKCKVNDVYDRDTITVIFPFTDVWNSLRPGIVYCKDKLRLSGIDTPEIRTKNLKEKEAGYMVRDWLKTQILGKVVWIHFEKKEKYGRLMLSLIHI